VLLRPRVLVAEQHMIERALSLHDAAHRNCFIARSVNFPVRHEPQVVAPS
jgi:organic hydroperoxide reductase OsmC/OhrA